MHSIKDLKKHSKVVIKYYRHSINGITGITVSKLIIEIPKGWIFSVFCNHSEFISLPLKKFGSYSLSVGVLPMFLLPLYRFDCLLTLCKQVPLLWQWHLHQHKSVLQDKEGAQIGNRNKERGW